jgi:dipeptidase
VCEKRVSVQWTDMSMIWDTEQPQTSRFFCWVVMLLWSAVINLAVVFVVVDRVRGGSINDRPKTFSDEILYSVEADRCTAIAVARGASVGGPMTTHTNDCSDCDFRIGKVPARDWPEGSKRPLYLLRGAYPSQLNNDRGSTWSVDNLEGTAEQISAWSEPGAVYSAITGYIPQVPHTFALFEGQYGIMNEHQVSIGESTCAAKLWAAPVTAGGKALIEAKMMTQIALERSTTARQAVQIMGDLATSLGFYAADWSGGDMSLGEGGESLTVIDKHEAWVFHVLGDDTGASAVWAAQRVPDDHVSRLSHVFNLVLW